MRLSKFLVVFPYSGNIQLLIFRVLDSRYFHFLCLVLKIYTLYKLNTTYYIGDI